MVYVSLDPRLPLDRRPNMWLASEPARYSLCGSMIVHPLGGPIGAQRRCELRGCTGDLGKPLFQKLIRTLGELLPVSRIDAPFRKDIFFQTIEPAIDDRPVSPEKTVGSRKLLHGSPVDGLQAVKRGFSLGYLDFRGGESLFLGRLLHPACKEGLSATILSTNRLEDRTALRYIPKFTRNDVLETVQADSEEIESPLGHGPLPQGGHDLSASFRADFHRCSIQVELTFQFAHV